MKVAFVAALALGVAGCGGSSDEEGTPTTASAAATAPPTASRLAGTWSRIGVAGLLRIDPKGTFAIARTTFDQQYASGTYDVQGSTIEFKSVGPACVGSWTGTAGVVDQKDPLDDELQIALHDDACDSPAGTIWRLSKISQP